MAGLSIQKLRASTLLEVIVSMVIIVGVFGVAMLIYSKVVAAGQSRPGLDLSQKMDEMLQSPDSDLPDSDGSAGSDTAYEKTVSQFLNYEDLVKITVVAKANGKQLASETRIIQKTDKNANK